MTFIKNLYHDEIRSGYLVTSNIKKVWNKQLEIYQEVDRICRKHAIPYWAAYETLLGAARHGGYISWDGDFDLCMMRPDFNRFREVLKDELLESGGVFEIGDNNFSQLKIAHSQTSALGNTDFFDGKFVFNEHVSHGLTVDIFALDVALDGTENGFFATNALNELMGTIYNFPAIKEHVQKGGSLINDWSVIETLRSLPDINKQQEFINVYATALFNQSSAVSWIYNVCCDMKKYSQQKSWYRETIYLSFESTQLPAPIDYEKVLTSHYGDWHMPINDGNLRLSFFYSADISLREFLQHIDFDLMSPKK